MRRVAALLTAFACALTGCGDEPAEPVASAPSTTAAVPSMPSGPEVGYLAGLQVAELLGDYPDGELLALGHAFCEDLRVGADPIDRAETPGDGTFVFEQVSTPVWAMDAIQVDFEARQHLCPDAR